MSQMPNVVFLGAGQMAEALMRGILAAGLLGPQQLLGSDVRSSRLEYLASELGVQVSADNKQAVSQGGVIFLSVKPQDVDALLKEVAPSLRRDQLIVSIAAGVPIAHIEAMLFDRQPVIRVMPNTPCLVRQGMAVLSAGTYATPEHVEIVQSILSAVGKAIVLPEKYMDAVTGLSGSGPAFVSLFVDALSDAGVRVGLPRDVANILAVQTILGTAHMLSETGEHPARLKEMVTSPGGTAIAGVHALERGGVRAAIMDAIVAATNRSHELGRAHNPKEPSHHHHEDE